MNVEQVIAVDGATAGYEIAPLPSGRYALRTALEYCSDFVSPWSAYPSRDACVDAFVERARHHFGTNLHVRDSCVTNKQRRAQKTMLQEFDGGLFGFVEPDVSKEATKQRREMRQVIGSDTSPSEESDSG